MTPDLFAELTTSVSQAGAMARVAGDLGALQGMTRAVEHADAVVPDWSDEAFDYVKSYLGGLRQGDQLIAPDVRHWAHSNGLVKPPSARAWGQVIKRAAKEGLIARDGHTDYGDQYMHTQAIKRWRKT
jgi:hypothetical protein